MASRLYDKRRWRRERRAYLARNPLCVMCEAVGKTSLATTVDHVVPHRGDETLFWNQDNWQALCKRHHDRDKQQDEKRGFSVDIGSDGWPLDPKHPARRE